MPLWASAHPLLAPLYASAGMANATAAVQLTSEAFGASERTGKSLHRLALITGAAELLLGTLVRLRWRMLKEARSFELSPYSILFQHGFLNAGLAAPLLLRISKSIGKTASAINSILAGLTQLAGGLLLQFVMLYGGRESGRHARDYFFHTAPGASGGGKSGRSLPGSLSVGEAALRKSEGEVAVPIVDKTEVRASLLWLLGLGASAAGAAIVFSSARKRGKFK